MLVRRALQQQHVPVRTSPGAGAAYAQLATQRLHHRCVWRGEEVTLAEGNGVLALRAG